MYKKDNFEFEGHVFRSILDENEKRMISSYDITQFVNANASQYLYSTLQEPNKKILPKEVCSELGFFNICRGKGLMMLDIQSCIRLLESKMIIDEKSNRLKGFIINLDTKSDDESQTESVENKKNEKEQDTKLPEQKHEQSCDAQKKRFDDMFVEEKVETLRSVFRQLYEKYLHLEDKIKDLEEDRSKEESTSTSNRSTDSTPWTLQTNKRKQGVTKEQDVYYGVCHYSELLGIHACDGWSDFIDRFNKEHSIDLQSLMESKQQASMPKLLRTIGMSDEGIKLIDKMIGEIR